MKLLPSRKWVYVFDVRPVGLLNLANIRRPLYLWRLLWCVWLGKVGFESDGTDRAANVEYSIRQRVGLEVRVVRVIAVKVFMYRAIEKAVHNVLRPLHSRHLEGCSGWTEIFREVNIYTGILLLVVGYGFGWSLTMPLALAVILTPYPVDMCVFVLILAGFERALCCVAICAAIYAAYVGGVTLIGL